MEVLSPNTFRRAIRVGYVLLALLFANGSDLLAQTPIAKEYQIKAAFLFNFAQFVEWPPADFTNADEPFCIGILGDDPFGDFLDETVRGEKVNGHPFVVQRYRDAGEIKNCRILFVSRSESQHMEEIFAGLKGKNILTVGDMEGFVKNGGVIRFVTEQNKIHFKVSLAAATNASLTISSKLLRLAEIVEPGKD